MHLVPVSGSHGNGLLHIGARWELGLVGHAGGPLERKEEKRQKNEEGKKNVSLQVDKYGLAPCVCEKKSIYNSLGSSSMERR